MIAYIVRRLLLMIPTLLGISLLVFLLIALAPGGVAAALQDQGGAQSSSSLGLYRAYLEDRYGLNDPVLVQYVRWLARISPIKFGSPDQIDPTGLIVRPPKHIDLPPLAGRWYAIDALPEPPPRLDPPDIGQSDDQRNLAYRRAANDYAQARAEFIARRVELENALREYSISNNLERALERDQDLRIHVLERATPNPGAPEYQKIVDSGALALQAMQTARIERQELDAVFRAEPYPRAVWRVLGVPLRLGPVHLGPPDFGRSFALGRPVSALIADHLPITLLLNAIAFPIIYLIAVPTGILAAARQGRLFDVLSGALFVALWSIPVVWAGVLAVGFLANNDYVGAFPVAGLHDADASDMAFLPYTDLDGSWRRGYLLDTLWHMALPVACLVYTGFAILSKQTRAAMLDNFNADYVRTAKAKGVPGRDIALRHVFRNSLLPLITIFATLFPAMLSGSVVVESIFSIQGMGKLILDSIFLRDRELLLANVLMVGGVNLLGLLLADILYAFADPRITFK